jgi:hypothetical protein
MNNEPVAWMQTWENQDGELKHTVNIEQIGKNDIPLYTHPAKTLTDEEIAVIWANHSVPMTGMEFKKVVEAILKKANNG